MQQNVYNHPEPVPAASQLAALPFLAGVVGYLTGDRDVSGLRATIHRSMTRGGEGYLQQACGYIRPRDLETEGKVGRTFAVNYGIMGAAFQTHKIWRTKHYPDSEHLRRDLESDIQAVRDNLNPELVAVSYLAVPFVGSDDTVVLVLYAESKEANFFADDGRVRNVVSMCRGFCSLLDWLQDNPFPNLRNFPLGRGVPVKGIETVYPTLQEELPLEPPRFKNLSSFNYEASVS